MTNRCPSDFLNYEETAMNYFNSSILFSFSRIHTSPSVRIGLQISNSQYNSNPKHLIDKCISNPGRYLFFIEASRAKSKISTLSSFHFLMVLTTCRVKKPLQMDPLPPGGSRGFLVPHPTELRYRFEPNHLEASVNDGPLSTKTS